MPRKYEFTTRTYPDKWEGGAPTPDDLRRFEEAMGETGLHRQLRCAFMLGVSKETYRFWREGRNKIPFPIGLAMAALVNGLAPFQEGVTANPDFPKKAEDALA